MSGKNQDSVKGITEVYYCGSMGRVAEYINMSPRFKLLGVICEERQLGSDILTFTYLRGIHLEVVRTYKELQSVVGGKDNSPIFLMSGFGLIIKDDLLTKCRFFNIHPCRLPDYKGRHPTFHATMNGDQFFGITLHEVNNKIDEGGIIAIEEIPYYYWMSEEDLLFTLFERTPVLLEKLRQFIDGKITPIVNEGGRYFAPVTTADKTINKTDSVPVVLNKVRAQSKHGGAILYHKTGAIYVIKIGVSVYRPGMNLEDNYFVVMNGKVIGIVINKEHFMEFAQSTIVSQA